MVLPLLVLPALIAPAAEGKVRKPRASVGTAITVQQGIGVLRPGPQFFEKRVKALLGKPDRPGMKNGQLTMSLDYRRKYGLMLYFDTQRTGGPLGSVVATHRQFRTVEGVRVGDTVSDIRRAYPELPMPCGTGGRICSILEDPGTDAGATYEQTQFVFKGRRIVEISVSSRVR